MQLYAQISPRRCIQNDQFSKQFQRQTAAVIASGTFMQFAHVIWTNFFVINPFRLVEPEKEIQVKIVVFPHHCFSFNYQLFQTFLHVPTIQGVSKLYDNLTGAYVSHKEMEK